MTNELSDVLRVLAESPLHEHIVLVQCDDGWQVWRHFLGQSNIGGERQKLVSGEADFCTAIRSAVAKVEGRGRNCVTCQHRQSVIGCHPYDFRCEYLEECFHGESRWEAMDE